MKRFQALLNENIGLRNAGSSDGTLNLEESGFHLTLIAQKRELVATIGAGYSDGYPPQLAGKAVVIIKNKPFL